MGFVARKTQPATRRTRATGLDDATSNKTYLHLVAARECATPLAAPDFTRHVVCLFGFAFDAVTVDELVQHTADSIAANKRCSVATPNVNFLRMARSDPAFRDAVLACDRCVIDGMPLFWLGRLLGLPLPERVAGSDFFVRLASEKPDDERGDPVSVFFLGGTTETCSKAAGALQASSSQLICAGTFAPGFGSIEEMSHPDILARINQASPDMLVLSIGARKGLVWLARNERHLHCPVISNLGATINFVAGTVKRAPVFWQKAGLEWLWRIGQEPVLWSRYAADCTTLVRILFSQVLPSLTARLWPRPAARKFEAAEIIPISFGQTCLIGFFGSFGIPNLDLVRAKLAAATSQPLDMVLDLNDVKYVDSAFLGLLLVAYGHQKRINRGFVAEGADRALRAAFSRNGCDFMLGSPDQPFGVPTAVATASGGFATQNLA